MHNGLIIAFEMEESGRGIGLQATGCIEHMSIRASSRLCTTMSGNSGLRPSSAAMTHIASLKNIKRFARTRGLFLRTIKSLFFGLFFA